MREADRGWLARALVILLMGTVIAVLTLLALHRIAGNEAALVLSPVVAVVGTVMGFYFGGKDDPA